MKTNKLMTKYLGLIKSNKMTKAEVNSFRKVLGHCSSLNQEDKKILLMAFQNQVHLKGGIKITAEHTEQGLSFIKSIAWTKTGKVSMRKDNPFGVRERATINNFKEFRLIELEPNQRWDGHVWDYNSIWLVQSKSEASFAYIQKGRWMPLEIIQTYDGNLRLIQGGAA